MHFLGDRKEKHFFWEKKLIFFAVLRRCHAANLLENSRKIRHVVESALGSNVADGGKIVAVEHFFGDAYTHLDNIGSWIHTRNGNNLTVEL